MDPKVVREGETRADRDRRIEAGQAAEKADTAFNTVAIQIETARSLVNVHEIGTDMARIFVNILDAIELLNQRKH